MSDTLAIATVTAVLRDVIFDAVSGLGATVVTGRPRADHGSVQGPEINLFLYQISPDATFRNEDLPTRDEAGRPFGVAEAAVVLRYLLTFYGDERSLMPQRLLGRVLARLHSRAVLTEEVIEKTIKNDPVLNDSQLSQQSMLVRVWEAPLGSEELNRLWSLFGQVPYELSIAYEAGPVLVSDEVRWDMPRIPGQLAVEVGVISPAGGTRG